MLSLAEIPCPYCGETLDVLLDASAGEQQYIEDCQVCCRPITLRVHIDDEGEPRVSAASENEA